MEDSASGDVALSEAASAQTPNAPLSAKRGSQGSPAISVL